MHLIGNGTLTNYQGLAHVELQHSPHRNFHKTHLSPAEEAQGYTRFYRWHMDAALYGLFSGAFNALIIPCVAQISGPADIGTRVGMLYTSISLS